MEPSDEEAESALDRMIDGYKDTQFVAVAARLGIADLLGDGPLTSDELADATGSDPDALYRVLRVLAVRGIFAELPERRFAITPISDLLRTQHPASQREIAVFDAGPWYRAYGALAHTVATGENAFRHVHGMSLFEYLADHPDEARMFDRRMTSFSTAEIPQIVEAYDFSGVRTVVDVGGGEGRLMSAILRAHPALRGVIFDQPHVVGGAGNTLRQDGVADRCTTVGGDFFEGVPEGADLYLLKWIIHDWEDEDAVKILSHCARAMNPEGRVVLAEVVIGAPNSGDDGPLLDVHMMVLPGGRERTEAEFAELFAAAGLRLTRAIVTPGIMCLLEAKPAPAQ
ncbi:methyltransferase [Nocardioides bizhenqiangii]|uniref:Methyltransferase n=1 Tax=Nocardioides bizhenqiangii TaxID=3095076 RepID=A0ABZ0ZXH7_9ACTN|nr:methyltransferase [Nocardioides sp. HM61]WQQ27983.1 methyltransferase [Nocardioides sp. HM61]